MADDSNPPPPPNPNPSKPPELKQSTSPSPSNPTPSTSNPSLASRISSSATGLLNSTFSPRAAAASTDIPGTLAAGLSGKGSSSSSSSHGVSGGAMSLAREGGSGGMGSASSAPGGGFRSTRVTGSGSMPTDLNAYAYSNSTHERGDRLLEMEFLQDLEYEALSRSGLHTPVDAESTNGKGKGKTKALDPDEKDAFERAWLGTGTTSTSTAPEAAVAESDGAAVSSLLSDPSFQPMFSFDAEDMHDADEPNPFLAPPQTITSTSTDPNANANVDADVNPLSLIPGLADLLASLPPLSTSNTNTTNPSGEVVPLTHSDIARLSTLLSSSDSELKEQNEPWLVLDRVYHDAVWGNWIEPYVRAAKEEVDSRIQSDENRDGAQDGGGVRDGPAVRRLGAILGHLRAKL